MTKTKRAATCFILGRENFAKISAVDGFHLTAEMDRDFRDFDRKGLSPSERRKVIARKYGKVRV